MLREEYVRRHAPEWTAAQAAITRLRGQENAILTALPEVMVMRDLPAPRPTFVLARGAYDAPTVPVGPGTPRAILPFPERLPKNRLGLAAWLFDPSHPLTARVVVNRVWAMFFGTGIVATVEDFGAQGELPTHPELLDWLATTLVESKWDLKALERRIVLLGDLPAVVDRERGAARGRSGEPVAGARTVLPPPDRADSRQRARGERPAGADDRRPERLSLPAARALGGTGDQERHDLRAGPRRRPVPAEPLQRVEAEHAAAGRHQLRRAGAPASASCGASARARRSRRWCC